MSGYVMCPKRGEKKVALEVCFSICETRDDCDEFKEVPEAELNAAMAKANKMPVPTSGECVVIDGVIVSPGEPEVERKKDPEEASKLIAKAMFIKDDIEGKFWELGEVLFVIFNKGYYVDAGYHDWREFCNSVLDIKWRTATYLKDIYARFSPLDVEEAERKGIGWTKLKELLPVVNASNVVYWLGVAKEKKVSVQVLNSMVKYALGKITKEEADKVPQVVAFRLYEEQVQNVERALEISRRLTGSDSRSYQLEMIAAEFRATYDVSDMDFSKTKIISNVLSRFEVVQKVKFRGEVTDLETGEILVEAK
jgi:hypothetical protein